MFSLSKSLSKLKSLSKDKKSNDVSNGKQSIKKIKRKSKKVKKLNGESDELVSGVVMISNIPHGFYEKEMFQYFSQFGKVLRLRISKNRKTGKSRKYGYIEFESGDVAKIAANTMNNYLMFDHILKCEFIPKSKVKPNLFRHWNKEFVSTTTIHKSLHNKNKTFDREIKLMKKRLKKVHRMEKSLSENGIDFKCEIINLPKTTKQKELMIVYSSDEDIEFKTPPNAIRIARRKRENVEKNVEKNLKNKKEMKIERIKSVKSVKSVRFPKLHKFSILRAANKRKSL